MLRSQLDSDTIAGFLQVSLPRSWCHGGPDQLDAPIPCCATAQENILDFIPSELIEDAASCAEYLSCADSLRDHRRFGRTNSGSLASRTLQ